MPYDALVKKIGGVPPPRRGSVVKLLGDSSLLPNLNFGTVIGEGGTNVKANFRRISAGDSSLFDNVVNFGNGAQS